MGSIVHARPQQLALAIDRWRATREALREVEPTPECPITDADERRFVAACRRSVPCFAKIREEPRIPQRGWPSEEGEFRIMAFVDTRVIRCIPFLQVAPSAGQRKPTISANSP